MKKLLKWVFPAILGIVPAFGMEDQQHKAFLSHEDATYRVLRVSESGNAAQRKLTATVEFDEVGLGGAVQRDIPLPSPFGRAVTVNWQNNDADLYANEKIKVYFSIFKDGGFLKETPAFTFISEMETNYEEKESTEVRFFGNLALKEEDKLPEGQIVDVYQVTKYQRPDTSTFLKKGTKLYSFLLEETITPIGTGWVATCTGCGKKDGYKGIIHSGGKHNLQAYSNARNVTRTLWQIPLVGDRFQKEQTTTKHATLSLLYTDRRDHNIKSDLQSADYIDNMEGWIIG